MTDQTKSQVPQLPEPRRPIPPSPIHPLAAIATLALDYVFTLIEIPETLTFTPLILGTMLVTGTLGFAAVTLVQHYLAKDKWGPAVAKGVVMGIVAGVPYSVAGTVVGIPLLAWAGLHEMIRLPGQKAKPDQLPADDEIVDAEVKEVK